MGTCYSIDELEKRVLILGLDNSGKTTILKRLLRHSVTDQDKALSVDDITAITPTQMKWIKNDSKLDPDFYLSRKEINKRHFENPFNLCRAIPFSTYGFTTYSMTKNGTKVIFTDVGGSASMRRNWKQFYTETDLLVYVIDSTDRRRLEETGTELMLILDENKLAGIPLLIFNNKNDVIGSLTNDDLKAALNIHLLRDRVSLILSGAAKTGIGIEECLKFVTTATKIITSV